MQGPKKYEKDSKSTSEGLKRYVLAKNTDAYREQIVRNRE